MIPHFTLNLTYILLSPTFGMHQYTADLANRAAQWSGVRGQESGGRGQEADDLADSHSVRLITTATLPRDRYSPAVQIITPLTTYGTGFSLQGLNAAAYRRTVATVLSEGLARPAGSRPLSTDHCPLSIVHFTGVHLWNLPLVYSLRRRGVPVIHTLHDLDPHHGVRFAALIRLWNRLIIASGCHLLVHGRRYRDQLIAQGVLPDRITYAPLLHGFLSAAHPWPPHIPHSTFHVPRSIFTILFFGRIEAYKGVDTLLTAWERMSAGSVGDRPEQKFRDNSCTSWQEARLIIAGPVAPGVALPPLPPGVELRDRRIMDGEADALFRSASLLVLPYRDATQSALVAAAYAYGLPVIVTRTGALPEYVAEGETGWVVPAEDPAALAWALRNALADPDRTRRMGSAARAWFTARRREEASALAEMVNRLTRDNF